MYKKTAGTWLTSRFALLLLCHSAAATAAVIPLHQVNSFNSSMLGSPVSQTDLINVGQPSYLSQTVTGYTAYTGSGTTSTAALNDGSIGTASNTGTAFDLDGTWTSTFNFNLATSPYGYDLSQIQTTSGWVAPRVKQTFKVSYAHVGTPRVFHNLGTYSYLPTTDGSAQITLTAAAGQSVIAQNVASLRFDFLPAGGTQTVYREIDVNGGAAPTLTPAPPSPVRLMPVGDSITRGSRNNAAIPGGYRSALYQSLTADGAEYDFVGSASDNAASGMPDPDHEGHDGYRIDQIRSNIGAWMTAADPDMILLHIGTNDILQNYQVSTMTTRLNDLIQYITTTSDAEIFVASIIPITQAYNGRTAAQLEADVAAYNAAIPGILAKYSALDRVHFVNMHDSITLIDPANSANSFFQPGDGIHPGQAGYNQMAGVWSSAIQAVPEPTTSLTVLVLGIFATVRPSSRTRRAA